MSYEKVKKIRITDNQVFVTSFPNNVFPKNYYEWEWLSLSRLLEEEGREAVEKEILFAYFEGGFQSIGEDKYQRASNRVHATLTENSHEIWKRCESDADFKRKFQQRLFDEFNNPPKRQLCCLERQDGLRLRKVTETTYLFGIKKFRTFHNPVEAEYALRKHNILSKNGFKVVIL